MDQNTIPYNMTITGRCHEIVLGLLILPKPEAEKDASRGWEQIKSSQDHWMLLANVSVPDLECLISSKSWHGPLGSRL